MKTIDFIKPKYLKIKGKQYARPFIFKYFLSMAELNLQADMDYQMKQIYSAFKIPSNLIQSSGDMLGKRLNDLAKSGITAAKAIENLNKALGK